MKFIIDENTEFSNKILLYLSIYRVLNKIATILLCLIIFCNFNNIFCLLFLVGLIIKNILLFFKIKIIINYDDQVLKKFESDICHLRQKEDILFAKYGLSKFSSKEIPHILPSPSAIFV